MNQADSEMQTTPDQKDDKKSTKKVPLRDFLKGDDEEEAEGEAEGEGQDQNADNFSTPVARVRSLRDNRNAIFVAAVTRQSDEDWDTLFEKERLREQTLREQFEEQRRSEEEEEKKAKVEAEKKQLPLIDQSKVDQGSFTAVIREVIKLVSEGEHLTDAVADAYQANNNATYTAAAREIVGRASALHLTALVAAAREAEKLGLALQRSKLQDTTILESRVDHIINIANQFDRLQTFLNKQKTVSIVPPQPTISTTTTTTTTTTTPTTTSTQSSAPSSSSISNSTTPSS